MEMRDLGITMAEAGERYAIFGKAYGKWLHTSEGRAYMIRLYCLEILTCKKRRYLKRAFGRLFALCQPKGEQDV